MLYLLLEEVDTYYSSIDVTAPHWKFFAQFDAENQEEALRGIPKNRYGKYLVYQIAAKPTAVTVKQSEKYEVQVSE